MRYTLVWFTVCLRGLNVKHCTHKAVMSNKKRPPSYFTKSGTKFCIYWERPPPSAKKRVLPHRRAQKMTKFCIYSKRPPPNSSKKWFQPQRIEISVCCTSLCCIFSLLGGSPPGKSSSRVFSQQFPSFCAFIGFPAPINQIPGWVPPPHINHLRFIGGGHSTRVIWGIWIFPKEN